MHVVDTWRMLHSTAAQLEYLQSLNTAIQYSLRTGSFARELGKREKKDEGEGGGGGGGRGRERENEPAGMTFKEHLRPPVKIALKYHADIAP